MASIYKRGGQLWARARVKDETGEWVSRKTPYEVGKEEKARRYVRKTAEVLEARRKGEAPAGPLTVVEYAKTWVMNRKRSDCAPRPMTKHGSRTMRCR